MQCNWCLFSRESPLHYWKPRLIACVCKSLPGPSAIEAFWFWRVCVCLIWPDTLITTGASTTTPAPTLTLSMRVTHSFLFRQSFDSPLQSEHGRSAAADGHGAYSKYTLLLKYFCRKCSSEMEISPRVLESSYLRSIQASKQPVSTIIELLPLTQR